MTRVAQAIEHVPQSIQLPANWTAVSAAIASFVGWIQGPLAVVASILSIIWLGLQIYGWFDKRRKR